MARVTNCMQWRKAVEAGKVGWRCVNTTDGEFDNYTVGDILACGVSNPYAPEYSTIGDIDTHEDEVEIVSLEDPDVIEELDQRQFDNWWTDQNT
jgi:hypothetical protein